MKARGEAEERGEPQVRVFEEAGRDDGCSCIGFAKVINNTRKSRLFLFIVVVVVVVLT